LGEFSPIGRLFSLASLLKITEVAQILGLPFSKEPDMYHFLPSKCWATLWATFSPTHLVTLLPNKAFEPHEVESLRVLIRERDTDRVARWFIYEPKILIWVNFGMP
jgi:hypothetical protein